MKSFSNERLIFFLQKVLFLLHFGSCQNCMSSGNLVAEMHEKLCNTRVLSTGEPCTCFHIHFPILAENVYENEIRNSFSKFFLGRKELVKRQVFPTRVGAGFFHGNSSSNEFYKFT